MDQSTENPSPGSNSQRSDPEGSPDPSKVYFNRLNIITISFLYQAIQYSEHSGLFLVGPGFEDLLNLYPEVAEVSLPVYCHVSHQRRV